MLSIKQDVKLRGLQPEMLHALDVAEQIYSFYGYDCILTSARGGKHSYHSHHYKGLAIDLRIRHLPAGEKVKVHENLQQALGTEYQVILESTHIHVEYDPRELPS